ncbi:hypothetical protein [Limnobacter sp. CACIAM 66H1]|uniref:hypothetical protein n=1 Tax=Limnobacter sp. CACIAM 66H1 TaxID=1813033 RepID=UPI0025BD987F|nr:hypothetical protein [Limnobacter sp. CACIAM 66H1]
MKRTALLCRVLVNCLDRGENGSQSAVYSKLWGLAVSGRQHDDLLDQLPQKIELSRSHIVCRIAVSGNDRHGIEGALEH